MHPIFTRMTSPAIEQESFSRLGSSSDEDDDADLVFDKVTSRRPPPKKQKREQPVPFEALQQAGWVSPAAVQPFCLSPLLYAFMLF